MKKIFLALIMLIIVGIFVPAVSAVDYNVDIPFSVTNNEQLFDHYGTNIGNFGYDVNYNTNSELVLSISYVQNYQQLHYAVYEASRDLGTEGTQTVWYRRPSDNTLQKATLQIIKSRNALGQVTQTFVYFMPTGTWDIGTKTGSWSSVIYSDNNGQPGTSSVLSLGTYRDWYPSPGAATGNSDYAANIYLTSADDPFNWNSYVEGYSNVYYGLNVEYVGQSVDVDIIREFSGVNYYSSVDILDLDGGIILQDKSSKNTNLLINADRFGSINVTIGNLYYRYIFGDVTSSDSSSPTVTIYIRNTQTDALIANAHINISASVDGSLHEIINETIPAGIATYNLQPTGGGMPNPDFYRLITTAEGYNSIMPYIDFEVDGASTIYAYLDPVGGAPEDENNTFIDFFVRDMSANPISGATVNFGGYTLITNSAGYTIFEVDKSKTYSWTVSKSGYGSLTGNAVIGDDPRHTINTVLAPSVTPTIPTVIPTSTPISPTPTMTSPTGEPVSNWLEWFAAHFGMLLGGGAEIGKIFMWLCFALPVGVYVGKEAKAGAAGFMAGAGIVTLFFVLIGWVPIWLLVLLALIIGLLYAKVFNNSDTGGGR